MSDTEIIAFVTAYADRAHGDQVRKYTGERYIAHPIRVMKTVEKYCPRLEARAAALLHDVLEDTPVVAREMEISLMKVMDDEQVKKTMQLVIELTDIYVKEDYPQLNRRTRKEKEAARLSSVSAEAQSIKYADIIDNVTDIVRQDADFASVFVREAKRMLTLMENGHPWLREQAVALVDKCLVDLPSQATSVRQ